MLTAENKTQNVNPNSVRFNPDNIWNGIDVDKY